MVAFPLSLENGDSNGKGGVGILTFILRVGVVSAIALSTLGMTWYQLEAQAKSLAAIDQKMTQAAITMGNASVLSAAERARTAEDVRTNQALLRQMCIGISKLANISSIECVATPPAR